MLSPPPPLELISSDSDSEDTPMETNVDRLQFLAASGLVQRPITKRQEILPPLPPNAFHPSPSISFHPSTPSNSHHPNYIRTPTNQCTPKNRELDPPDNDDPLSKMEAAFSRYLNIQRDLPSPSDSPSGRKTTTARHRKVSQSVSGPRPSPEQLKSPRPITTQNCHVRHNRTSSAAPSFSSSTSHGFRSWLTGMSKSVSNSSSLSGNSWLLDRRQSSSSAQGTSAFVSLDRPRPSVSGPIHTIEDLPPRPSTAGNSSSLMLSPQTSAYMETRTWSSLVDSATLSKCTEKEKNRQEAIYELIKTEAAFVENCQILSQVFYQELEPVIGPRASTIVFANVEDIMLFGATFLSALERRQLQSGSYHVETVGDIVLDYMQGVHVFRPYCINQANASRALNDLKQRPAVANLLNGLKVKGLELEHYLLQPMQRLTRYPLLITQIIKYTEEASVDAHRLANALKKVQDVLTATNEAVRKQENEIALMTISEQLVIPGSNVKLSLATKTRFVGARRLIREGLLTKSRSRKRFRAFLFNDFFLLARPVVCGSVGSIESSGIGRMGGQQLEMYRAPMALEECQVMPGRDSQTFLLLHHHESFPLKVPDGPRACDAWLADFKAARKDVFKALVSLRSRRGLAMAPF